MQGSWHLEGKLGNFYAKDTTVVAMHLVATLHGSAGVLEYGATTVLVSLSRLEDRLLSYHSLTFNLADDAVAFVYVPMAPHQSNRVRRPVGDDYVVGEDVTISDDVAVLAEIVADYFYLDTVGLSGWHAAE